MKKLILALATILFLSCGEKKEEEQINLGDYNDPIDSTNTADAPGAFSSDTVKVDSVATDSVTKDSGNANPAKNQQNLNSEK